MNPNNMTELNRRTILSALGMGLTSTFLPSLERRAMAASPSRILILTSTHQIIPDHWRMTLGNPAGKEWSASIASTPDASFSPVLRYFAPFKDRALFIDGMAQVTGIGKSSVNNHDASGANLLTGAGVNVDNERELLGRSVDQFIADEVQAPGRLRSVELGTYTYAGGFVGAGKGQHLPVINSVSKAFSTLFANVKPMASTPAVLTEREKILAARQDAVAAAQEQFALLKPRLSKSDQERFASHLDLVNKYKTTLAPGAQLSCSSLPTANTAVSGNNENFFAEMGRLVAHAFACDATRVATLQMGDYRPDSFGASGDLHQDMAHNNGSATGIANLRKYNLAVASAVSRVVAELAKLNLLESTLVVWMSEHGLFNDAHKMEEMPVVMVGNVNAYFKTGRYVSVPRTTMGPRGAAVGKPHNHFLVSLMQAMGSTKNSINIESWLGIPVSGPLSGLT